MIKSQSPETVLTLFLLLIEGVPMSRVALTGCIALLLVVGAGPATQPATIPCGKIGESMIVLGELGVPVGQEVTISGRKERIGPLREMFHVDRIDGKPAPADLSIQVPGIDKWPEGTRATLRGSEVGTLRFPTVGNYNGPDDPRLKGRKQELVLRFEVSRVVAPEGLDVKGQ